MFSFQRRLKASKTKTEHARKAVGAQTETSILVLLGTMAAAQTVHHRNVMEPVTQDVIV
jgi:hypothetical protein